MGGLCVPAVSPGNQYKVTISRSTVSRFTQLKGISSQCTVGYFP